MENWKGSSNTILRRIDCMDNTIFSVFAERGATFYDTTIYKMLDIALFYELR